MFLIKILCSFYILLPPPVACSKAAVLTMIRNSQYEENHSYTTIPTWNLKIGVAAPEGTNFTAYNLARVTANLKVCGTRSA